MQYLLMNISFGLLFFFSFGFQTSIFETSMVCSSKPVVFKVNFQLKDNKYRKILKLTKILSNMFAIISNLCQLHLVKLQLGILKIYLAINSEKLTNLLLYFCHRFLFSSLFFRFSELNSRTCQSKVYAKRQICKVTVSQNFLYLTEEG